MCTTVDNFLPDEFRIVPDLQDFQTAAAMENASVKNPDTLRKFHFCQLLTAIKCFWPENFYGIRQFQTFQTTKVKGLHANRL